LSNSLSWFCHFFLSDKSTFVPNLIILFLQIYHNHSSYRHVNSKYKNEKTTLDLSQSITNKCSKDSIAKLHFPTFHNSFQQRKYKQAMVLQQVTLNH